MSTAISFRHSDIIFTSQIPPVEIVTDNPHLTVTISANGTELFCELLYPYNGVVTVYDVDSLVEEFMRNEGLSFCALTMEVSFDDVEVDSFTWQVIYCDRDTANVDAASWLASNFLTTLQCRRIAPEQVVSLPFFAKAGESPEVTMRYFFRNTLTGEVGYGQTDGESWEVLDKDYILSNDIHPKAILYSITRETGIAALHLQLLSIDVSCGERYAKLFVDKSLFYVGSFAFRNCFNVVESASFVAETTAKLSVERETATLTDRSVFYDQSSVTEHEVQSGPITAEEAAWLDQLFTSRDVNRLVPILRDGRSTLQPVPVLISDITSEMSDSDNKPNSAKFTWRYASNRTPINGSIADGRIFTDQFDYKFS